ncbi:MAG: hypothetical protein WA192_20100 [Candidatus Acidiferrales bacterium]
MKAIFALLLCICLAPAGFSQSRTAQKRAGDPDRLGLTCAEILHMDSAAWVAHFNEKAAAGKDVAAQQTIRALAAYGKCYDARTSHLAAVLGRSGKGPLMGARGNFSDFQSAVQDFAAKALAAQNPPASPEKSAYATLYEKQFRYQFYQSYEQKDFHPRPLTPEEADEFSKAKNHFGELLGLLPEDRMHTVHAAFSANFDAGPMSDVTKLELYRFAIFVFESPTDKPFSPPPF